MELYRLIATIKNHTPDTVFEFEFLPENFEGVKISQSFSFVNPIGYTPKFSIETMRVIKSDKTTLDAVFLQYGLESDVEILIKKLDIYGFDYEVLSRFSIDFESYVIDEDFSEFALKSISAIDDYNKTKNTDIQIPLSLYSTLPNTQKFINFVSVKSNGFIKGTNTYDNLFYFIKFQKNQDAKIYDNDSALFLDLPYEDVDFYDFNNSGTGVINKNIKVSMSGEFKVTLTKSQRVVVAFCLTDTSRFAKSFYDETLSAGSHIISLNTDPIIVSVDVIAPSDYLFAVIFSTDEMTLNYVNIFVDAKKETTIPIIDSIYEKIKYIPSQTILNKIFNNKTTFFNSSVQLAAAITSANSITLLNDFVNIKPKDFFSDWCLAFGMIANFRRSGYVRIMPIDYFFDNLFELDEFDNPINSILIENYKELSIKYNTSLNFASVSVGEEINSYDLFSYLTDWNKILTFAQEDRNASENLDLTMTKLRTDFSGILDAYYKRSQQSNKKSKDNFIFNPNLEVISGTSSTIKLYDYLTPRVILSNWSKFISFCFQNFGKNTLTISSNGGTSDNLQISGVNQMDDFILSEAPRLLPIEYEFTCLIEDIEFSEKILTINHNGEYVYLFVIKSETTDNLSEQKINALKIQF